ncbi:class I SAM-dependent methyltransferase [Algoriphagus kandeliae]|nr:class I SAM-dependent methyltransferase [Algoriphagus kandeliae]
MKDQFRWVTSWYRPLSRLIFGDQLSNANRQFLSADLKGNILIIGGGDGLDYVDFAKTWRGEYWELSNAMLEKAKTNLQDSKLSFHLGSFSSTTTFDWVLLPFVLDTMSDSDIRELLGKIKKQLKPEGKLILSEFFQTKNFCQKIITKLMIWFFKFTASHPRSNLPNYEQWFRDFGFELVEEKKWRNGWIRSQIWEVSKERPSQ